LQLGCVVLACVGRGLLTLTHLCGDLSRSGSGERIGVLERLGERTLLTGALSALQTISDPGELAYQPEVGVDAGRQRRLRYLPPASARLLR
jgi:hypothetical protein